MASQKLVTWDADFLGTLSDDSVSICISEKQQYLIGQIIDQLTWPTRWQGDISALDLDAIAGNLEANIANESAGCIMNCDDVENCLITSPTITTINTTIANNALSQAQIDYINSQTIGDTTVSQMSTRFPESIRDNPISTESLDDGMGGCDYDKLYGGILELVTSLAQRSLDMIEIVTAKADVPQRVQVWIDILPILGDVVEAIVTNASGLAQDTENLFNAYRTTAIEEQIACDLFCMVRDECRWPTFKEVGDYYANLGASELNDWLNIAFSFMFDYVFGTNGLASMVVYYGMNLVTLTVLYMDAQLITRGGRDDVTRWLNNGTPNDDHLILCACSPGWCYEITPSTNEYGIALINWGVQVGTGLQTEIKSDAFSANYVTIPNLTLNRYYSGLIFDLGQTYLMSDMTVEIEYTYNGDLGANDALRLYTQTAMTNPPGHNLMYQLVLSATGNNLVWTRSIDAAHNARYIYVDARCIPDGLIIHRVRLSDSVNPRPSGIPMTNC